MEIHVIGDGMFDEYRFFKPERLSPEGPVPVCSFVREERRCGGAMNVSKNIAALAPSAQVKVYTARAHTEGCHPKSFAAPWINQTPNAEWRCYLSLSFVTIVKRRYLTEDGHLFFREDIEGDPAHNPECDRRTEDLKKDLKEANPGVVVISDYNKGSFDAYSVGYWLKTLKDVPIIVNCKPGQIEAYRYGTVLVLNEKEACDYISEHQDVGVSHPYAEAVACILADSYDDSNIDHVIVTRGSKGMEWYDRTKGETVTIPAVPVGVVDVTGAGDTVVATIAAHWHEYGGMHRKLLEEAAKNAALVVAKVGTATV